MTGKQIVLFGVAGALFLLGYASAFPSGLMLSLAAGVFVAMGLEREENKQ
jgi:hypothetical protein